MKPLIGVPAGGILNRIKPWAPLTYGQTFTYTDSIIQAGGLPVILPITDDMSVLRAMYDRLDGLLFAGGNDIDPTHYGEVHHQATFDVSERRDKAELALMDWAVADDLSVLAICRGMQIMNVSLGGSLYQDIADQVSGASNHNLSFKIENGTHLAHKLKLEPGSKLAKIVGSKTIAANTHHHQGIKKVGKRLRVSTRAEDGIIEGIELPDATFAIGVQCHPEEITEVEPKWALVFDAFVKSCKREKSA